MRRVRSLFAISIVSAFALAASAQLPSPTGAPVKELGDRRQDTIYPFSLIAQNLNCNTPQDFRFDLSEAPFVMALQDPVVRQLPPGGEGAIPAQLMFGHLAPGAREGIVTIICETCGYLPFVKNCRADRQRVILHVNVLAPEIDPTKAPQPGPAFSEPAPPTDKPTTQGGDVRGPVVAPAYTRGQCLADVSANLAAGLEGFLTNDQKIKLNAARDKAAAAAAAARKAHDDLDALKKKKRDCWEELAALRAAQAEKEAAAATAQGAADAAQAAADGDPAKDVADAEKKLADYDKDVADAQKALDRANKAAMAQEKALDAVLKQEKNSSSPNVQSAIKYYNDASKAQDAAKANLDAVKASKAAREADLAAAKARQAAAQAAADAKKAEADAAKAAAGAAKDAADAKERECLGLDAQIKAAEAAAGAADNGVQEAGKAAGKAEAAAAGQAADNLDEQIRCKKEECERLKKEGDEHFRQLTNAQKALEQLGYFNKTPSTSDSGPIAASAAKKGPDSLWGDYTKLGLDKFLEIATELAGHFYPGKFVPGSGVNTVLDVLQAAYGIAGIRQSALTPGTYAHGRTEGETLHKWLQDNNFAHTDPGDKDAKEVEHQMERLMADPNVALKDLASQIEKMEKCKAELAALEAQKAAAGR